MSIVTRAALLLVLAAPLLPQEPRPRAAPVQGASIWLENLGQWRSEIRYGAWIGSTWVAVGPDGLELHQVGAESGDVPRIDLRLTGVGDLACRGTDLAPGLFHDYHGGESQWIRGVRAFRGVELLDPSSGLRLLVQGHDRALRLEVLDLATAERELACSLSGDVRVTPAGDAGVNLSTAAGRTRLEVLFERGNDRISSTVEVGQGSSLRFWPGERVVPPSQASAAVAPTPELLWSTLWGSVPTIFCNLRDRSEDAFVDPFGHVTVVGTVAGTDYLLTPGSFHTAERCDDLFVAKFDQTTGDLIYSARIGSTSQDQGKGVAVDATGRATAVGWVGQGAQGFPTTPTSFDPIKGQPDSAAVVFRLSPLGDDLEFSTYLEGSKGSQGYAVALAESGAAIVVGTAGQGFPTTPGAYSASNLQTVGDLFVTRLDPTGTSLEFSTRIGGLAADIPVSVELDVQESVIFAGSSAQDYPTTPGAFQGTWQGVGKDAFVSCLDSSGSTLLWSTFVGGMDVEECNDMALTPDGGVMLVGMTQSTDFPTTPGALQATAPPDWNGWVARVDSTGSKLVFGTYLGGTQKDESFSVAVDGSGLTAVGGHFTNPMGFPVTPGAFQTTGFGGAFLAVLAPDGGKALYTTFLAGAGLGEAYAVTGGTDGLLTVGGLWQPSSGTGNPFPTTPNALVPNYLGSVDAFITTLWPQLQGVQRAGTSSSSCLGPLNASATTMPLAGQPFGLYCTQAPPDADGFLITFNGELMPSIQPVKSGAEGYVETVVGNLPSTPGKLLRYRYAFRNTPACPGQGPFSFSNLVVVQVQ